MRRALAKSLGAVEERFVIQVKTDNAGTSADNQYTLGWIGTYDVDWGDGNTDLGVVDFQTHTYTSPGTYEVKVKAPTGIWRVGYGGDYQKCIDILNWGTCAWTSMENALSVWRGNQNITAIDIPNLTQCTNMYRMFRNANFETVNLVGWDVTNVTTMQDMFRGAASFTNYDPIIDVSGWDMSNCQNIRYMFSDFGKFGSTGHNGYIGDISNWDTGNVVMMDAFAKSDIISGPNFTAANWDITNVINAIEIGIPQTIENYDATLINFASQSPQSNLVCKFGANQYSYEAAAARQTLIDTYGWTITDGGQAVSPEFVIQVKTDNAGVSEDNQFELAVGNGYNTYDYNIETSDGQVLNNNTGNTRITFPSAGTYQLKITGVLPSLYFQGTTDKLKVTSIINWGTNPWLSLNRSFIDFRNCVINATDLPNLSQCTSLKLAFYSWQSLVNWDVTNLDVSNVTNFEGVFQNCVNLETLEGINNWQIGDLGIDGFKWAFNNCRKLTSTMEDWDVTNIRNIGNMFSNAYLYDNTFGKWNITGDLLLSNRLGGLNAKYLSTPNYDDTLIKWENQLQIAFPNGVGYINTQSINFGNAQYSLGGAAEAARNTLINTYGWTITDGGGI